MAGNHRIVKIQAPVPTVATGEHALLMTVFKPDDNAYEVLYVSTSDANWSDSSGLRTAMCDVDGQLEFC